MKEIILQGNYQFKYEVKIGPKKAGNWRVPVQVELHIEAQKFPHCPRLNGVRLVFWKEEGYIISAEKLDKNKNIIIEAFIHAHEEPYRSGLAGYLSEKNHYRYIDLIEKLTLHEDLKVKKIFYTNYKYIDQVIEALKTVPQLLAKQLSDGADIPALEPIIIKTE